MRISRLTLATVLFLAGPSARADDAAPVYLQAAKMVTDNDTDNDVRCPASSNFDYLGYPPFSTKWINVEKEDFLENAEARALAHQARSIEDANWPSLKGLDHPMYLNPCRALANDLADAALYQHTQGNDAAAIESLRDLFHFADLLQNARKDRTLVQFLVGIGIRALATDRLAVVVSGSAITQDPKNIQDVQFSVFNGLISYLIKHPDAQAEVDEVIKAEGAGASTMRKSDLGRLVETTNRVLSEGDMVAVSLACHLYRFDHHVWPKSLDDLHDYLPKLPIDPFGDGKQTFGYVLVKAGLPDGADRPLVYSRCHSEDGLFILNGEPHYSYYNGDDSLQPRESQKRGGQFRDVAAWAPPADWHPVSATQPVQ